MSTWTREAASCGSTFRRGAAGHHHGLLGERGQDVGDQLVPGPRRGLAGHGEQPATAGGAQPGRPTETDQQLQHRRRGHPRAQHPLQRGVDLGEQTTDAVADPVGLDGLIIIEPDQHAELGQRLLTDIDPAQRMRHGAGRLGDDVGVPGVGLGRPRMQVSDPAHRQTGQVGHLAAGRAGDRDRQRTDGGRLVDHHQHRAVGLQIAEQPAQLLLILGQRGVVQPGAGRVQRHRVVGALADVQSAEDRVAALTHCRCPHIDRLVLVGRALDAGSHVTKTHPQVAMSLSAVLQCHQAR